MGVAVDPFNKKKTDRHNLFKIIIMSSNQWTNTTCDVCADGCGVALCAWFCNPCYWATTRNMFDESNWCFNLMCLNGPATQSIIREAYDIEGSCFWDCVGPACCACCTAIRARTEVQARGSIKK